MVLPVYPSVQILCGCQAEAQWLPGDVMEEHWALLIMLVQAHVGVMHCSSENGRQQWQSHSTYATIASFTLSPVRQSGFVYGQKHKYTYAHFVAVFARLC
jgi:hypothetical protein